MSTAHDTTLTIPLWEWTFLTSGALRSIEHGFDHNDFVLVYDGLTMLTHLLDEGGANSKVVPLELREPLQHIQSLVKTTDANDEPYDAFADLAWREQVLRSIAVYRQAWLKWRDHELGRDARGIVPA